MDYIELVKIAYTAAGMAYAPYSDAKVGAALLTDDGSVYTGCNIENSSYGATICAERAAVSKAVSDGKRSFTAIAIASNLDGFTYPCGICRQVLAEFSPDMDIVLCDGNEIKAVRLSEIFPNAFKL